MDASNARAAVSPAEKVTVEVVQPNAEKQGMSLLGDGPIFGSGTTNGPTRAAVTVPESGSGNETKDPSPVPDASAATTIDDLAKQGVGPQADKLIDPADKQSRKLLPGLERSTASIDKAVMAILKKKDIHSVVESKLTDWYLIKEQVIKSQWLMNLIPFNLITKQIVTDAGFASSGIIPFHALAVVCLVKGNNASYKRLNIVIDALEAVKSHALAISRNHQEVADMVLKKVFTNHAKAAHPIYCSLVQVSNSDGLCPKRAIIIMDWIDRLKPKVDSTYEILMKDEMFKNMQSALYLQVGKGRISILPQTPEKEENAPEYDE
jgi:hypothetical protein